MQTIGYIIDQKVGERILILQNPDAFAIDGDDLHYSIECPFCNNSNEYIGWFDSCETYECSVCQNKIKASKLWIDDETYIE